MEIRTAVIPAAGLGTRFLPMTKSVPKELLPILDKPMLQYVVEEASEAGIERVIIVTARGKESIASYFQPNAALERHLAAVGADNLAEKVRHASSLAQVSFVIQEEPLGLGHAVLTAEDAVDGEPFVVILPDDIIAHTPGVVAQMLGVQQRTGGGVIAVERTPWGLVHNYGVVDARGRSASSARAGGETAQGRSPVQPCDRREVHFASGRFRVPEADSSGRQGRDSTDRCPPAAAGAARHIRLRV